LGQFCVVLPEQDVVVATTGGTEAMQAVLDRLWTHLLPGFGSSRPDDTAQPALETRLGSLALAPCTGQSAPSLWEAWTDAPFPVTPTAEDLPPSTLTSVDVRRAGERLEVTIAEPTNALTFPVGDGRWLTSAPRDVHGDPVPVAASGGWLDEHTLRVEVIFLETPHRMDITCSLPARCAEADWRQAPLDGGSLRTLHRPR
jgi:hypothetical protein